MVSIEDLQIILYNEFVGTTKGIRCSVHAEVVTYYRIPERLRKQNITMLVVRTSTKDVTLTHSGPCPKCQKFIKKNKIKLYYSDYNGNILRWNSSDDVKVK